MATEYDEFGLFEGNATDAGLAWDGPPTVRRENVQITPDQHVSALVWGTDEPELVFLHGGAQNAHTWDTVAMALDIPMVAIDLPGHGRSSWRDDHVYDPPTVAADVSHAVQALAPQARGVVGMSMGGLTTACLAHAYPELVRKAAIIDVTPGTDAVKAEPIIAFVDGPEYFTDFDEILGRTIEFNPTRSESSLRRGVLHNAYEMPDGRWAWRYDRERGEREIGEVADFASFWDMWEGLTQEVLLLRGADSSVVGDEDIAEFQRRRPSSEVIVVEGAGHSIQGDKPLELAELLTTYFGL
jgi:pimeloyl-ACP methyl ester carboxylesterase